MVWTIPMTFVSNTALTASQLNTFARDNLNETASGRATTAGYWFVSTGKNIMVERPIATASVITGTQTTFSTSYVDLTTAGPAVTVPTGKRAIAIYDVGISPNSTDSFGYVNVAVSGATTISPGDDTEMIGFSGTSFHPIRGCFIGYFSNLTEGSNTFTMKYKTSSSASCGFIDRRLTIICV